MEIPVFTIEIACLLTMFIIKTIAVKTKCAYLSYLDTPKVIKKTYFFHELEFPILMLILYHTLHVQIGKYS